MDKNEYKYLVELKKLVWEKYKPGIEIRKWNNSDCKVIASYIKEETNCEITPRTLTRFDELTINDSLERNNAVQILSMYVLGEKLVNSSSEIKSIYFPKFIRIVNSANKANQFEGLRKIISHIEEHPMLAAAAREKKIGELIKLIPLLHNIIDDRDLIRGEGKKLEKNLVKIEKKINKVLELEDSEAILNLIKKNSLALYSFIARFQNLLFKDEHRLKEFREILAIPQNISSSFEANKSFLLVVISGASATGKDAILHRLKNHTYKIQVETLRKFTTRKRRPNEALYSNNLSNGKFEKYRNSDRIIFPYIKREISYGFDKKQLYTYLKTNTLLFCIFTEFNMLEKAKLMFDELHIDSIFILLQAPAEELINRSVGRGLQPNDVSIRINSINSDDDFINQNHDLMHKIFDHRIYSGDEKALNDTVREIKLIIDNYLANRK